VLLLEEPDPGKHFLGPLLCSLEPRFERSVLLLQFERSFRVSPSLIGQLIELFEPSFGREGALSIARQLLA
jgi:hypothetical protein